MSRNNRKKSKDYASSLTDLQDAGKSVLPVIRVSCPNEKVDEFDKTRTPEERARIAAIIAKASISSPFLDVAHVLALPAAAHVTALEDDTVNSSYTANIVDSKKDLPSLVIHTPVLRSSTVNKSNNPVVLATLKFKSTKVQDMYSTPTLFFPGNDSSRASLTSAQALAPSQAAKKIVLPSDSKACDGTVDDAPKLYVTKKKRHNASKKSNAKIAHVSDAHHVTTANNRANPAVASVPSAGLSTSNAFQPLHNALAHDLLVVDPCPVEFAGDSACAAPKSAVVTEFAAVILDVRLHSTAPRTTAIASTPPAVVPVEQSATGYSLSDVEFKRDTRSRKKISSKADAATSIGFTHGRRK